jgi:hypothetical protein
VSAEREAFAEPFLWSEEAIAELRQSEQVFAEVPSPFPALRDEAAVN